MSEENSKDFLTTQERLTTHVLDTARGTPANGLTVTLYWLGYDEIANERKFLIQMATNSDGRTDRPLISGADFKAGIYEIEFTTGAYMLAHHSALIPHQSLLFLNIIPIRFGIADNTKHYHVPLLLSPFGYSTYRGS